MGPAASLLKEKHHGVLISAVHLCTELCKASSEALEYLRKVECYFINHNGKPLTSFPVPAPSDHSFGDALTQQCRFTSLL